MAGSRYSVYLLHWYKSTNADAEGAAVARESAARGCLGGLETLVSRYPLTVVTDLQALALSVYLEMQEQLDQLFPLLALAGAGVQGIGFFFLVAAF